MPKPVKQDSLSGERGLVISYFGSSVAVEAADGQVFQCHLRRNQELPVVGDWVRFEGGTITGIEPRRSALSRGEGHGKAKVIAANIDAMLIVMSPPPIFSEYLTDRYLVAAELLKLKPILVLNKSDLLNEAACEAALSRLKPYQNVPYPVVLSSTYTKEGLQELSALLKDKSAVLVGPSGVGKSSIISALGNHAAIPVGEVSAKGSGKHTTTATRLYHLPEGGQLIDSPGVREFNLWPVTQSDVLGGFREFQAFLSGCKFRDCLHVAEPGCAVQAALASGKISLHRYESYQKLMKEAASHKKY
jgi:ribosome biogenesis GTPase